MGQISPESCTAAAMKFRETELTLGLPGEGRGPTKTGLKRGFSELGLSGHCTDMGSAASDSSEKGASGAGKLPGAKVQVVGWPPIRASRKNVTKICKYVKVAVDGAPYLRKVNLETYNGYEELLRAVEDLFSCFSISKRLDGWKIMDHVNGVEYVPTYEDREGDWMLIGDVPWKMFVESCKRLRLMKSSEAIGLAPRTPAKSTSSSC